MIISHTVMTYYFGCSKQDKDLCLEGTMLELDLRVFDMWLRVEDEVEDERETKG